MKKSILLILMFIAIFFVGENRAFALECSTDEEECTLENLTTDQVICSYQVTIDGKSYYNWIAIGDYDTKTFNLYGGTSYYDASRLANIESGKDSWVILSDNAYSNLVNNFECPMQSYIDYKGSVTEICFDNGDNDGSSKLCKNGGKKFNGGTNFNNTTSSKLEFDNAYLMNTAGADITWSNACDISNYMYATNDTKACQYRSEEGNFIFLYYDNTGNSVVYRNEGSGESYLLKQGQVSEYLSFNSCMIGTCSTMYNVYSNRITRSLNSCPNELYLYDFTTNEVKISGTTTYYNKYIYETANAITNATKVEKFLLYKECEDTENKEDDDKKVVGVCENTGIFSPEIIEIINEIMTIIRIGVPILLIGLVIYDFATAVFASSDDQASKVKGRAIKRVIIAIAIFFVPTLINFVFGIVNEVWGTNFEICVLNNE